MINRKLSSFIKKTQKSVLLLGPRQTGKSTLINQLKPDLKINFADQDVFLDFAANPKKLKDELSKHEPKTVFIDEIQRLPSLMNTIQSVIDENKKLKFYLTGSSARKLKRGRANLLPGRIISYQLGPLIAQELNYKINTKKALELGLLPEAYLHEDREEAKQILRTYSSTYLKEEIQAEAIFRNLESFLRFFTLINESASQFIDYTKIAKKTRISRQSCTRYFEVLEDTLVGERLFPFQACIERADLIKHPKFYLFDTGVYNGLSANFNASADRSGILSEMLIYSQIKHSALALQREFKASTFRTRGGVEVDFIFEIENDVFAIEVKSSDRITEDETRSLKLLKKEYYSKADIFLLHTGTKETKTNGVWCLPWQEGLKRIGL